MISRSAGYCVVTSPISALTNVVLPLGGIATLHANNAVAGLTRLVTLVSMNPHAPRFIEPLVGEAVDVLVHIERKEGGAGRVVREVLAVEKWDVSRGEYVFQGLT